MALFASHALWGRSLALGLGGNSSFLEGKQGRARKHRFILEISAPNKESSAFSVEEPRSHPSVPFSISLSPFASFLLPWMLSQQKTSRSCS